MPSRRSANRRPANRRPIKDRSIKLKDGSFNDHLPTVLLIEVFSHLLTSPQDHHLTFINARRTLCMVCKYWRDIIVGYPRFWSTYRFCPYHQHVFPSVLKTWLRRSANMPLSIYISSRHWGTLGGWWTPEVLEYNRKLRSLLSQGMARWKRLDIESTGKFINMIQELDFTSAHSLQEVSLHIVLSSLGNTLPFFLVLNGAPNLTSLKLYLTDDTTSELLNDPRVFALFKRLVVLDIDDNIEGSKALDVIRTCASAERIRIRPTHVGGPMIMASSERLSILEVDFYYEEAGAMLAYLHLPNLKVLSVHCRFQDGENNLAHLVSALVGDPSRHALQVLRLDDITFDALEDLVRTQGLSRIPVVEFRPHIRKSDANVTNAFDTILREKLERWEEIDSRSRICSLFDSGYGYRLIYAVGWVDSRWYEQHRQALPCDILDSIHIDRLLV